MRQEDGLFEHAGLIAVHANYATHYVVAVKCKY